MKKFLICFLSLLILGTSPFFIFFSLTPRMPKRYTETFSAGLVQKLCRLEAAKGKKIILVGGSSLPFGVKSALIEDQKLINDQQNGYTVVNFGLYADLGTKLMMDLSKENIAEDDIVILAPELDAQTYSLYFNPTSTLMALEERYSAARRLPFSDRLGLFCNSFGFNIKRILERNDPPIEVKAPYSADSLDIYGEISTERPSNIMPEGYISDISLDSLENPEFFDYVNRYNRFVKSRGAVLYFSFSPINSKAIAGDYEKLEGFYDMLTESLDCELLGKPYDFIYDQKYFYDTNFHLNDAGAVKHSVTLIDLLKKKLGIKTPTDIVVPEPDVPVSPPAYADGDDSFADCFEYERKKAFSADGSEAYTYTVTGVKSEFQTLESLILPSMYEGFPVTALSSGALAGMSRLKEIVIPKNCTYLAGGAFEGCESLERIYILSEDAQSVFVPFDGSLTNGCGERLRIIVPAGRASLFKSNYTWKVYSPLIEEADGGK